MARTDIPKILLQQLQNLEPGAEFTGTLPKIHSSNGKCYFVKLGSPRDKDQFYGEAASMRAINTAAPGIGPHALAVGVADDTDPSERMTYYIGEYKDLVTLTRKAADVLAQRLATELHMYKSENGKFGFGQSTNCGPTRLENGWFETWEECYNTMIGNLLEQLGKSGRYGDLCRSGEEVRTRVIPKLLGPLKIQPVLMHGDLWSGNTGMDRSTGQPVIFDPASFYGHNESDLAITRIFGGLPKSFYDTYHEHQPRTEPVAQYNLRADLYELFHYLNHTLLFGGHYAASAVNKMDGLLKAGL